MATINGTPGNDVLTGTSDSDSITGQGGDDRLEGGGGNDYLEGNLGTDLLYGGDGDDFLNLGGHAGDVAENDRMYGEDGNDLLQMHLTVAAASSRVLDGGSGNDRLTFDAWYFVHDVTLAGGDGDDRIFVNGARAITIDAGAGADFISFVLSSAVTKIDITLGAGSDIVELPGMRWSDDLSVPLRITDFDPAAGGDRVIIDRVLYALVGADRIANPFSTGHLALEQREGVGAVLKIDFNGGGDLYRDLVLFEGVSAGSLGIANIGFDPTGANGPGLTLDGGPGADRLIGSGHTDSITGGDGDDELSGHSGNDVIDGGLANDRIEGGWGHDVLRGGDGDDEVSDLYGGDDELYGGEGNDRLVAERSSIAPFSTVLLDGGAGNDSLRYAPLNSVPYRRMVDDAVLRGGEGNDDIYVSSARNATIEAGDGNDRVSISNQGTIFTITLGPGTDSLSFANTRVVAPAAVTVTDFEPGETGDSLVLDSYLRDQLPGWDPTTHPYEQGFLRFSQRGADSVLEIDRDGPAGSGAFTDLIVFQNVAAAGFTARNLGGYSIIEGTEAGERIEGTQYLDLIRGKGGDDELIGGSGRDTLLGGEGNDRLDGGGDADRLDGGTGADIMRGGGQDDVYIVDDAGDQVIEDSSWSTHGHGDEVRTSLASYTLPAYVENLTGTSAAGQALTGNEGENNIVGGAGDDVILLLGGINKAQGQAGNDRIEGGDDKDQIWGGPGSDTLFGHGGDDFLTAAISGVDAATDVNRLEGGDGNDSLWGSNGHDTLIGGSGNDWLRFSDGGNDVFDGGDGDDTIEMSPVWRGPQSLSLIGGSGNDTVYTGGASEATLDVDLGAGNDSINFNQISGAMTVTLGSGSDTISISPYSSVGLFGSVTITDFATGAGGDRMLLQSFLVAWLVDRDPARSPFATGHLRLVQDGADTLLQIDRDGGGDAFVTRILFQGTQATSFAPENLDGFRAPSVFGTHAGDTIRGTAGNDRIEAGGGRDILRLEQGGDDVGVGGDDADIFFFGAAFGPGDRIYGNDGTDTLVLQGDYPALILGAASLTGIEGISLQSGSITRWGATGTALHDYALTMADANVTPGELFRVNGQSLRPGEDLDFDGTAETDGGRFLVYAGFGQDLLTGGSGNDIFFFEAGRFANGDRIVGGAGNDAVVISGVQTGVNGPVQLTIATGTLTAVESLSFNGRFATEPGALPSYEAVLQDGNVAPGGRLIVNASSLLAGQSLGFDGSLVTDGRLAMFGGAGADRLTGGANADLIYAAGGADTLAGGGGADLFEYRSASDSTAAAADRILDFVSGSDRIDLSQIDADVSAGGDQAFAFIGSAAFSNKAGELRSAWDPATNSWSVEGDVDGDGGADFLLYVTTAGAAPAASDFIL
jgi:Ca2+-binding RTX toxin-like protein